VETALKLDNAFGRYGQKSVNGCKMARQHTTHHIKRSVRFKCGLDYSTWSLKKYRLASVDTRRPQNGDLKIVYKEDRV